MTQIIGRFPCHSETCKEQSRTFEQVVIAKLVEEKDGKRTKRHICETSTPIAYCTICRTVRFVGPTVEELTKLMAHLQLMDEQQRAREAKEQKPSVPPLPSPARYVPRRPTRL